MKKQDNKIRIRDMFYRAYECMKRRCLKKTSSDFPNYGGRGIKVCKRWLSYKNFCEDMKKNYKEGLTLDRIDNSGNYCKENCKWATRKEQARNRRGNRVIKGKTLAEWSEILNISVNTLYSRANALKWSDDRILSTPLLK